MAGTFINLEPPNLSLAWLSRLFIRLGGGRQNIIYLPEFTVASLPSATDSAGLIAVTDETGGYTIAFSDGTNWRRVQDRAIIS